MVSAEAHDDLLWCSQRECASTKRDPAGSNTAETTAQKLEEEKVENLKGFTMWKMLLEQG